MGCWGITAFESDSGLDAVDFIRNNLPKDGNLELEKVINALQQDRWNAPSDVIDGDSHSSPMALVETMVKFIDQDMEGLDYDGEVKDNKFGDITSFHASGESLQWLKDYISDTLDLARKNAEYEEERGRLWNGWFVEKDWLGWQEHMETLISRLDELLAIPGNSVELLSLKQLKEDQAFITEPEDKEREELSENVGMSLISGQVLL